MCLIIEKLEADKLSDSSGGTIVLLGRTIVPPGSTIVPTDSTMVTPDSTIIPPDSSIVVVVLQYYSITTVINLHSNESKSDISAHEF